MNQGITLDQAVCLIEKAQDLGFVKVKAELERIGYHNLTSLMGNDQKKKIYSCMYHNDPVTALKHLSNYPSDGEPVVYEDEKVTIQ